MHTAVPDSSTESSYSAEALRVIELTLAIIRTPLGRMGRADVADLASTSAPSVA